MRSLIIGRDSSCDYVIYDPKKRISRKHVEVMIDGERTYIKDIGSTNGTYINEKKLLAHKFYEINYLDKVTLSADYNISLRTILTKDNDNTLILKPTNLINVETPSIVIQKNKAFISSEDRVVEIDRDKTTIGEMLEVDYSPFKIIGRGNDCHLVIDNANISRQHCQLRLMTSVMIEIEDLGSANGTFANGEKLIKKKKYQFDSSVTIKLGKDYSLDLRKLFPNIQILKKKINNSASPLQSVPPAFGSPATREELKRFDELEEIWIEFNNRQNEANNLSADFGIGGAIIGMALGVVTGGVGGAILSGGGGVLGRYLGQQESAKIHLDLNYETAFLETYCCPRCKESFQKKPWITIRDCFRCKIKFRQ